MIKGETVTVQTRTQGGVDGGNNPVWKWTDATVNNVLVAPGSRSDVVDSSRPDGTEIVWTLHFPKTFTGGLRNARVIVRGGAPLDVVGDPQPYTEANTPGLWNRPVEVGRVDG